MNRRIVFLALALVAIATALLFIPQTGESDQARSSWGRAVAWIGPATAEAAPTQGQFAAEVVYRNWNARCGEGTGWWCSERRQRLENYPYRYDRNGRVVSWDIHYCWVDRSAFSWKQWCVYIEADTANMKGFTKGSNKILNSKG